MTKVERPTDIIHDIESHYEYDPLVAWIREVEAERDRLKEEVSALLSAMGTKIEHLKKVCAENAELRKAAGEALEKINRSYPDRYGAIESLRRALGKENK